MNGMFDMAVGGSEVSAEGADHGAVRISWREIDRRMRAVARKRAALDAEEASLLLAAKRAEIHKYLGYGSFTEYLERVCGHAPTTARDRIRVAEALDVLPATAQALAAGTLSFSAVRELTRVATPETESAWLSALEGCTVREIEDNVRGHGPGDLPDDRPDPASMSRVVRLELPPQVYALFLDARRHLERAAGTPLTDAELVSDLCRLALSGADVSAEPTHQVSISVCPDCDRGWHDAAGRSVELPAAAIERARCDAIELGRVDGPEVSARVRTIPLPVRRAVLARDHHRCTIPGCRSSRHLDLHHIIPWSIGGEHTLANLTTLCGRHHDAAHDGLIQIAGMPGALVVTHADGRPYGTPPPPPPVPTTAAACSALTRLGFRAAEAAAAVRQAATHVGATDSLETLIRTALRYCPKPIST